MQKFHTLTQSCGMFSFAAAEILSFVQAAINGNDDDDDDGISDIMPGWNSNPAMSLGSNPIVALNLKSYNCPETSVENDVTKAILHFLTIAILFVVSSFTPMAILLR